MLGQQVFFELNSAVRKAMTIYDTVREILKRKGSDVWSISPESTVYQAIEMMANKHVGALLVMTGDRLVGILSERDYARKVILKGRSSKETPVQEIMSSPVIFTEPQHTVDECMKIMTDNRIRHLPVLEEEKVTGIVSIGDLVNWIISAQNHTIEQLQNYVTGKY
jgi:CBS domain-containing protein